MITTMTMDTSTNMNTVITMTTSTTMGMTMSTTMGMTTSTTTDMTTITGMTTDTIMGTTMIMIMAPRKPMTTANMSWFIITLPILMKRMWQAIRTNANARPVIPMKSTAIFAGRVWPTANAVCRTRTMSSAFTN